jgi:hypothetical protein
VGPSPPHTQVTILTDATASQTPEVQAANLYDMGKMGFSMQSVEEWAASLGSV